VVREAIEAATGRALTRHESAKDYGPSLIAAGFQIVNGAQAGDVAIFPAIPNHPHGHIQVFTGSEWLSDFVQRDIYPGPNYRNKQTTCQIYRFTK